VPRLRRYARSLVFEDAQGDDLVQSTLERALTHAHQDMRRKQARMQVLDPSVLQAAQDSLGGDPGVDVGLRLDLLAALARLSPEQREPLLLVCVEQFSYAEVAEVMRIPVGTVMSRVCRARATLRALLDGQAKPGAATLRRVV
jgi:RNA polymerase sigma-70 factor, ECF subfamily